MRSNIKSFESMRKDAASIFQAGLDAVEPAAAVHRHCKCTGNRLHIAGCRFDLENVDRIFVVGAGKASAPMAVALEALLGDRITDGIVTVKYGHGARLRRIELVEAGHPTPDDAGRKGAESTLRIAQKASERDLIFCLISGGGSALMPLPAPGIHLADKQKTTEVMLACGATIQEINAIRKHISAIKGGHLARIAAPAPLISLILSDVTGDNLDVIASGPTAPDSTTFADCLHIIEKYAIASLLPEAVLNHIRSGAAGAIPETPKPGEPFFGHTRNQIIGSNVQALLKAKARAGNLGYHPLTLSSKFEGDTREAARFHAAIARETLRTGRPVSTPACILSGGETTVKVCGRGLGGRNQEFALAFAMEIQGQDRIVCLSAGTDGTDGSTDAAGAFSDSRTMERAQSAGLDPEWFLAQNDSHHFFKRIGDLFVTGPTQTNVMDLRILLVA